MAFAEKKQRFGVASQDLAQHILMELGLTGHLEFIKLDAGLNLPVVDGCVGFQPRKTGA